MNVGMKLVEFATNRPLILTLMMVMAVVVVGVLVAGPLVAPDAFWMLRPLKVDTDPENMLSKHEPVRVFHDRMKEALSLYDMVVVGVVNERDPNGVFNVESLKRIHELAAYAKTLRWPSRDRKAAEAGETEGVISVDLIAPSTVDNIEQAGPGSVRFEWLMAEPPKTPEEALAVRDKALRIPFLNGTMVSEDGKAIAMYLPLTSKDMSYKVYKSLGQKIQEYKGDDRFFITGLPVAEDTFGVEMFIQMAISAPLAMVVIFLLMLLFFRKLVLIISPMIVAMVSVLLTMGLLIVTGNTIHIMSSMIPIFIMPYSVLDSVHILSEFFDRYQETRDRHKTILNVMRTLFMPMLYTSLTTAAGFASLALTPIPPVQVFGIFVAIGTLMAWLLTVTFVPAYVMFIKDKSLATFGAVHHGGQADDAAARKTWVGRFLHFAGEATYTRAKLILAAAVLILAISLYGMSRIQINDNPIKWFKKSHPIRLADTVLNQHFGGTYMAYLALRPKGDALPEAGHAVTGLENAPTVPAPATESAPTLPEGLGGTEPSLPTGLSGSSEPELPAGLGGGPVEAPTAPSPADAGRAEVFKEPEALRYIAGLQDYLATLDVVGKSNSLTDIVKTVHRELIDGSEANFKIPDSRGAVAECLVQYESSHRPQDLWHFVTPDYRTTSLWVQLRSGDNVDMSQVVAAVEQYFEAHPAPESLKAVLPDGFDHEWFGLTYINVVWQEKMVYGMMASFLGSFLVVLFMMIVLFRSGLWAFLSMIPLTITIALIYGVIGLIGKDYDMPVAVLSSLTLGMSVDFAIHFLARARTMYPEFGSWEKTHAPVFGEPARAITRNIIVIAMGFLPLLFAPLLPYVTVGIFMATIMLVSGLSTLILLPALCRVFEPMLFPRTRVCAVTCRCGTCLVTGVTAVLLVAVNVGQFLSVGITKLTWISLVAIVISSIICFALSRRNKCRVEEWQASCEKKV